MNQNNSVVVEDKLYQSLWDEAVAAKQSNIEFSTTMEKLVEIVRNDVLPIEVELGGLLKKVLHKQLGFCQRRALSEQHRNELNYWMEENVHTIKQMGMADEDILEKTALAHAKFNHIPLNPNSDMSMSEQLDRYYADQDALDKEDTDSSAQQLADDSEQSNIPAPDSSPATVDAQNEGDKLKAIYNDLNLSDLDDTVFQKLFRKVANALHPDKESNEQLREKKQRLMSSLLESRKNYDLVSLLELHTEYVPDMPEFTIEDKRSLATVLYYFIQQEKSAANTPILQSSLHVSAYKRFYEPVPEKRNANLEHYVAKLKERREAYSHFVNDINTVFKLGAVLDKRLVQKNQIELIGTHALATKVAAKPDANTRPHSERYEYE